MDRSQDTVSGQKSSVMTYPFILFGSLFRCLAVYQSLLTAHCSEFQPLTAIAYYIILTMSKPSSRLDKLPQPLMLSKKLLSLASDTPQNPYRLSQQPLNQKAGLLSDMKQQLSLIKDGMEKLLVSNEEESTPVVMNVIPEVLTQTLKDELAQSKQLQERLRKQLQKCKSDNLKLIEETRQAADRKLELVRREHKEEKLQLKMKIQKIEQSSDTLKQNLQLKEDLIAELRRLSEQNQNDHSVSLKLLESKYQSSLGEFKKLQQKFIKSQKGDLATVQHRLYQVEQENSTLRVQNANLKCENTNINNRLERTVNRCNELRQRNSELEDKVRIHIRNVEYSKQIQQLKRTMSELENQKTFLAESLEAKKTQYQHVMTQLKELTQKIEQNQEIHKQRLQIVALQVEIGELKEKNAILVGQIDYLKEVLEEKESYIQALEDQPHFTESSSAIKELEERCQALVEEKNKIVREYEQAIATLQSSEKSFLRNSSFISTTSRVSTNFDEALKQQIQQTDSLRMSLREKSQEVMSLKLMMGELERRMDAMKNQFQIQKIRLTNQSKSTSKNLQYSYQSTKQELEILKKKEQTWQKKLQMKVDQLRKKDEFIQKHLIGKIGKEQSQSEAKYLAQQLQRFMGMRLSESTVIYESLKLDTPRMYKHPSLLRSMTCTQSTVKQSLQ